MIKYSELLVLCVCVCIYSLGCETSSDLAVGTDAVTDDEFVFRPPVEAHPTEKIADDVIDTLIYAEDTNIPSGLNTLDYNKQVTTDTLNEPFYKKWITEPGKVIGTKGQVIAFDAVPISDVVFALSDSLGFEYIIDPQVSGSVSMSMDASQLTIEDAWQIFEQILWLSGAYCSPIDDTGRRLHILPFSKMPQERRMLSSHKGSANVEVHYYNIRHASSNEVVSQIKPFLTPGATAFDLPRQNAILLIEAPANLPKLKSLMEQLDKKNKAEWPQVVVPCFNIPASHIIDELAAVLPVLGFPVTTEQMAGVPGSIHLTSLDRIQVIIASAANMEAIEELKRWVAILDKSDIGEQEKVFIYNIINGKAAELSAALSAIFKINSTSISSSSEKSVSTASKSSKSSKGQKSEGQAPGVFDVPVSLFADEVHNRFLIRTTPRAYAMVKAVLNRMDSVTPQVLIQVMIAEITLTDDLEYGVEFHREFTGETQNVYGVDHGTDFSTAGLDAELGLPAAGTGGKFWIKGLANKFIYIQALAGKTNTKVLSTPQILTESHQEAIISVGTDISIKTSETVSDGGNDDTNFQYKETGIILKLTPHITKGGLISIEMDQEVSDISGSGSNPNIERSQFKTRLSLRDQGTVIVGGLIKEFKTEDEQNIPYIQNIPLIHYLFGSVDNQMIRKELLVLITGRIIKEASNLEEMTERYDDAMKLIKDQFKEPK